MGEGKKCNLVAYDDCEFANTSGAKQKEVLFSSLKVLLLNQFFLSLTWMMFDINNSECVVFYAINITIALEKKNTTVYITI